MLSPKAACLFLLTAVLAQADVSRVLTRTYTAAQAKKVDISVFGAPIEVITQAGAAEVVLELHEKIDVATEAEAEEVRKTFTVEFLQTDDGVALKAKNKSVKSWFRGQSVKLRVVAKVPEATQLDLSTSGGGIKVGDLTGTLRASTSGGGIELERLSGESKVSTSGGSIRAKEVDAPFQADTSGGSIRVGKAKAPVKLSTSGGSIHVGEAAVLVQADTSGGSIEVDFITANPGSSRLSTSGGGVHVRVPAQVNALVDLSTSGGSAKIDPKLPFVADGEVTRTHLKGRVGQGGESIVLRTSGGGVSVQIR